MQRRKNIFFYSRMSKPCKDLYKLMNDYGVLSMFHILCIEDMNEKDIPRGITHVPTLLIFELNKSFKGKEAIEWFNNNRIFFMKNNSENQQKKIMYNMMKNAQDQMQSGLIGYSETEHKGISDIFAFSDIDVIQQKEFCTHGEYGGTKDIIYTPPQDKGKMNDSDIKTLTSNLESIRTKQEKEVNCSILINRADQFIKNEIDNLMINRLDVNSSN